MSKIAAIAFFTLWTFLAFSQPKISNDSLVQLLETEPDTARVKIYNALFNRFLFKDTKQARAYARSAIDLAFSLKDTLAAAKTIDYEGISFGVAGNMPEALESFIRSYDLYHLKQNVSGMAKELKGIGNVHQQLGNLDKALEHHLLSLEMYQQHGDTANIIAALNNVGLCFKTAQKLDSAIVYFEKRLGLARASKNMTAMASTLNNLAGALKDQEAFDLAEKYYLEALDIRKEQGAKRYIGLVQGNLGELYFKKGDLSRSRQYYEMSIAIRQEAGDTRGVALNSLRLSQTLREMGNVKAAITAAGKAAEIAVEMGVMDYQVEAYDQLQKAYEANGDYQSSLMALLKYNAAKDSVLNKEKAKQVAELETKFGTQLQEEKLAQQSAQISLLESKNKAESRLRAVLIGTGLLLLVLLGSLLNRYQIKRRSELSLSLKNTEIHEKNTEIKEINKELERKMLRAQMDPHFIFNSLNSIQHFITTNEQKLAIKYLSKFSKLIRKVLDNSINDRVPLSEEISLLEDYMELEALRLNNSFSHTIEVEKDLDIYNIEIPFLIIQPYVENAIKHGLKNKNGAGKLTIHISEQESAIKCTIEDNGIGRAAAHKHSLARDNHKSHGMSVTQKRLDILNKSNQMQTKVFIEDLKDPVGTALGTKVHLTIPHELY